jgi:hypothetical protein
MSRWTRLHTAGTVTSTSDGPTLSVHGPQVSIVEAAPASNIDGHRGQFSARSVDAIAL